MSDYKLDDDGWLYSDPAKPWEILRFVADATARGDEVEYQSEERICIDSDEVAWVTYLLLPIKPKGRRRCRIKPRTLAPYWKPLVEGEKLPIGSKVLDEAKLKLISPVSRRKHTYWLGYGYTHWATFEDVAYGGEG